MGKIGVQLLDLYEFEGLELRSLDAVEELGEQLWRGVLDVLEAKGFELLLLDQMQETIQCISLVCKFVVLVSDRFEFVLQDEEVEYLAKTFGRHLVV